MAPSAAFSVCVTTSSSPRWPLSADCLTARRSVYVTGTRQQRGEARAGSAGRRSSGSTGMKSLFSLMPTSARTAAIHRANGIFIGEIVTSLRSSSICAGSRPASQHEPVNTDTRRARHGRRTSTARLPGGSGTAPEKGDSRLYKGCTDGQGLEEIRRTYGLANPGRRGESALLRPGTVVGIHRGVAVRHRPQGFGCLFSRILARGAEVLQGRFIGSGTGLAEGPAGAQIERARYANRVGGCDNSVTVLAQQLRTDEGRVYLSMVCAS